MNSKTEAIVLHAFRYGERKMIVDMFTREHGRLSFVINVPQTQKGRLKKQYFQPLMLLAVECDVKQGAQLQKLKDATLLAPLPSLLTDTKKLCISLFIAEFLYHALKGEQRNKPLFDYVRNSVEWLDGRNGHVANFHLVFLMRLSRFLGFYPNLEMRDEGLEVRDESPVYFDLRAGTFCAAPPLHRDYLLPPEAGKMRLMMRMDYPTMHLFQLSHHDRQRLLDIALCYYRLHLPAFPELQSLEVLKEVFATD